METLHLTCTAMNRPELFRRMLETLLACGPQGWQLHVGVEPGPEQPAFRAICAAVLPEGSFHVHENRQRLGVNWRPMHWHWRAGIGPITGRTGPR